MELDMQCYHRTDDLLTDCTNMSVYLKQGYPPQMATTHIVLDLLSLICGFGERCAIVHCITYNQQMYP